LLTWIDGVYQISQYSFDLGYHMAVWLTYKSFQQSFAKKVICHQVGHKQFVWSKNHDKQLLRAALRFKHVLYTVYLIGYFKVQKLDFKSHFRPMF
jgi:hypothetical protein